MDSTKLRIKKFKLFKLNSITIMKNKILILFFCLFLQPFSANCQNNLTTHIESKKSLEGFVYQLFPTQNYWTFIKLDTRNGKMWQVHFTISKDGYEGEVVLNSNSLLLLGEEELKGRFTLYPTNNIYNFILLDQVNGKTYQVQWNSDIEKRFVSRIY